MDSLVLKAKASGCHEEKGWKAVAEVGRPEEAPGAAQEQDDAGSDPSCLAVGTDGGRSGMTRRSNESGQDGVGGGGGAGQD